MKLHQINGYIQNIFLVEYEHGCLLLDGASRADFDVIKAFFKNELKRPFNDLKVVVVTHMHPDHAGCAHLLRKATGAKIVSGRFEYQWYSGIRGLFAHLIDISLAYWVANRLEKPIRPLWYSGSLLPDLMLDDNQSIPGFEDWKVINTVGHTDRDISLVNSEHKIIYVADLIVRVKGQFSCPYPAYMPNEYKNSIRRLEQFDGYQILMAHVPNAKVSQSLVDSVLSVSPRAPRTFYRSLHSRLLRVKQLSPMRKKAEQSQSKA